MITEKIDIEEGRQVDCGICIIGGGPAAVSIALELSDLKKKIIILTGGTWKETAFNQSLHRGTVETGSSHEPLEANRRRQFGGGSAAWGGRCIPFEPIDFMKRDWVNESGWPFDYRELLPYYKKAAELTKIGEFNFNVSDKEKQKEIIPGMDSECLSSTPIEKWSPPVNFAKEYKNILNSSEYIHVYLNAHALKICTDISADNVSHVEAYMNGKHFKISAEKFILATGGLENPRLLLSSSNINHPNGIGNKSDNVGRYYMAHLGGIYAELNLKNPGSVITEYEKDKDGIYFRRRWWVTDYAQKEQKLRNTIFFLDNPNDRVGHVGPFFSSVIAAKSLISVSKQKSFHMVKKRLKDISPTLKKHTINFLLNGLRQTPDVLIKSLKRIPKRRLPSILHPKNNKYWGVYFQAEQTPYRESRVTVTNKELDTFGLPRLKASIKIIPEDIDSVVRAHNLFVSQFLKSGAGTVDYTEEGLRECIENLIKYTFNSGAHHLGTTRMSISESNGVVDANAKVFGIKNLFIAGASVFPTGGHANPTFTIIAQSLRLANHLKKIS